MRIFSLTFYFCSIDVWFLARSNSSVVFRDVLSELNHFFLVFVSRVQEEPDRIRVSDLKNG